MFETELGGSLGRYDSLCGVGSLKFMAWLIPWIQSSSRFAIFSVSNVELSSHRVDPAGSRRRVWLELVIRIQAHTLPLWDPS